MAFVFSFLVSGILASTVRTLYAATEVEVHSELLVNPKDVHGRTNVPSDKLIEEILKSLNFTSLVRTRETLITTTTDVKKAAAPAEPTKTTEFPIAQSEAAVVVPEKQMVSVSRTIRKGVVGQDVKNIQAFLKDNGFLARDAKVDGVCGAKTVAGIKELQKSLGVAIDGALGKKTFSKLTTLAVAADPSISVEKAVTESVVNTEKAAVAPVDEKSLGKRIPFDADFPLYKDTDAGREYMSTHDGQLPPIHDAWGYPPTPAKPIKGTEMTARISMLQKIINFFTPEKALAYPATYDSIGIAAGGVNCRATTTTTGYFKAYFDDMYSGIGYGDPNLVTGSATLTRGQARRDAVCHALQDLGVLLKLDTTNVTPEILFRTNNANPVFPLFNAPAGASAYYGFYPTGQDDNGSLHKYILSRQDPTPSPYSYDAIVFTNFNGSPVTWDVDTTAGLSAANYSLYTVIYHEMMHTLGFANSFPQSGAAPVQHTKLNENMYTTSVAPANRFLTNTVFKTSQVPTGSPTSAWFTNTVYQGVRNFVGGIVGATVPVFTLPWAQKQSLSHFVGTQYLMRPTIAAGEFTAAPHADEKEVLCHLGYRVLGLVGCDTPPTPVATDDVVSVVSPASVCIDIIYNDTSYTNPLYPNGETGIHALFLGSGTTPLSLNDLQGENMQAGDSISYYAATSCTGAAMYTSISATPPTASISGAKSIKFTPAATPFGLRKLHYTIKDSSAANRISFPAQINILAIGCTNDPTEYICNGDFELGLIPPATYANNWQGAFSCQGGGISFANANNIVPFWCDSQVLFPGANFNSGYGTDSTYLAEMDDNAKPVTKLKAALVPGTYSISFDAAFPAYFGTGNVSQNFAVQLSPTYTVTGTPLMNFTTPTQIFIQNITVTDTAITGLPAPWQHYTGTFTLTSPANNAILSPTVDYLSIGYLNPILSSAFAKIDNVSLKQIPACTTNTWTAKANFSGGARNGAISFSIGTKLYMGTGVDSSGNYNQDFWEYDQASNTWTQKADVPGGVRAQAVGFSIGAKGYVGLGIDSSYTPKQDFYEYDPTTNTWTAKANFGGGLRSDATGFSINTKGYVGMGIDYSTDPLNPKDDFWEYNPAANTWTQKANFGGSTTNINTATTTYGLNRMDAVSFSIGTLGYVGTGSDGKSRQADFWEYAPNAILGTWTQKANVPGVFVHPTTSVSTPYAALPRNSAVGFSIGTKGYVGTGTSVQPGAGGPIILGGGPIPVSLQQDFWEYNPTTNVWTQKANFTATTPAGAGITRSGAAAAAIGSTKGYIGTGTTGTSQQSFYEYCQ